MVEQHLDTFRDSLCPQKIPGVLTSLKRILAISEDTEWDWEVSEKGQKRSTLEKGLHDYLDRVQQKSSTQESLLHLNEVLDLLRLDWLFSGLLETGHPTLST